MAKIKRILVNPTRTRKAKSKTPPAAKRRKRNPGTLTVFGLTNPQRKTMKTKKKNTTKRANPKRRRNPAVVSVKKTSHRRRRNPSLAKTSISSLKMGVLALIGLVATRQLPQMLLKEKNAGIMGYLANFAAMLISSTAASKTIGKDAGHSVAIGGSLYIANRILSEQFSPIGKALSLSGLGDAQAATPAQLGSIQPAYWNTPALTDANGQAQLPPALAGEIDARVRAATAPPTSKVSGYRMGRY